jgi:hypothetical protein
LSADAKILCDEPTRSRTGAPNFKIKLKMNAIQREYIRNAQKAIKIASDVKFNAVAYGHQVNWAEAYWTNYLKSTGAKHLAERVIRLRTLLAAKDTQGALKYLSV